MSYLDTGFNQYLQRNLFLASPMVTPMGSGATSQGIEDVLAQGILADQITGGQFKSKDGSVILNLEEGYISITASGQEKLRMGNVGDGISGLVVFGADGRVIVKLTDKDNFIRSPDGCTAIEFDLNRITVRENDETGPVRVLLGYDPAGF